MNNKQQYLLSVLWVALISTVSFIALPLIGYKSVAILLLFAVSVLAMLFNIRTVLLSATLSALVWDFFFIPPVFTFSIGSTDDKLMLLMYFVVALVNAVFSNKIKQMEEAVRKEKERENTISLYNTILNSLSHELRTPISTIIAATDNMLDGNNKLSGANKQELVHQISLATLRLNRQVENLLNMSRLESGTLQLKRDWCDVNELVYDALNHTKDLAQGQHIEIQESPNMPLCYIDGGLIGQVLNNLLQNAFTYVKEKGHIRVAASAGADGLTIAIEDDGEGFPDQEREKVFDKFYRLKNSNTGGTGLGLSIVKGYIEAHQGKIALSKGPLGGALFTIVLPCKTQCFELSENE